MASPKSPKQKADDVLAARAAKASKYGLGLVADLFDFTCPESGALLQLKRVDILKLVEMNILDSVDGLTSLVSSSTIPGTDGAPLDAEVKVEPMGATEVMKDPAKFRAMVDMIDAICVDAIVQPRVLAVPKSYIADDPENPGTMKAYPAPARVPGEIYVDQLSIQDRSAIMDAAVTTKQDLSRFRPGSESAVAGVPAGADAPVSA